MIAVMGATGNTGGVISRRLLESGEEVRVLGRSAERLAGLASRGAEVVAGDAEDARYLRRAFAGADAAYTLMPYDVAHPDYRAQQRQLGTAVADALSDAGVGSVVALSSVGADVAEGTGVVASLYEQEQRLRALEGVDVLFLRPGMFFETFFESLEFIAAAGFMGDVVEPDTRIPMVASHDVAVYAAEALRRREHVGKAVQELLGPRDLTYAEVAAILGERIGRPGLEYVRMPAPELQGLLVEAGISPDFAAQLIAMGEAWNEGTIRAAGPRDAALTPTPFEEFAAELAQQPAPVGGRVRVP
jgi:uncharacterized protein YbjT (DUF2867 family)